MRIAGSRKEFGFLMRLAVQMKGTYLYFGPSGDFWMIYDISKTIYLRTNLDVSHHIVMSAASIHNVAFALNRFKSGEVFRDFDFDGLGADYMELGPMHIQLGFSELARIPVRTHIEKVSMFSPLVEKFEIMKEPGEIEDAPYICTDYTLLRKYTADAKAHFRLYNENRVFNRLLFHENEDEHNNLLQVDPEGELRITRRPPKSGRAPEHVFHYTDGWFVPDKYQYFKFGLSDMDIRLMVLLGRYEDVESFRVWLFKDHYVIDAHESDLLVKMWLNRKKVAID